MLKNLRGYIYNRGGSNTQNNYQISFFGVVVVVKLYKKEELLRSAKIVLEVGIELAKGGARA